MTTYIVKTLTVDLADMQERTYIVTDVASLEAAIKDVKSVITWWSKTTITEAYPLEPGVTLYTLRPTDDVRTLDQPGTARSLFWARFTDTSPFPLATEVVDYGMVGARLAWELSRNENGTLWAVAILRKCGTWPMQIDTASRLFETREEADAYIRGL